VEELTSGASGRILRVQAIWPVLLAGTLFMTVAASPLGSKLGMELRNRGLIPEAVYRAVFYWGTLLVPLLLSGAAWLVVLLGKDPPGILAAVL
jgi:hypothetical protein